MTEATGVVFGLDRGVAVRRDAESGLPPWFQPVQQP